MSTNSTDIKKKLFMERHYENACNISKTCKDIGIDRGTYYQWREKDKKFNKMCEEAEESLLDFTESMLMKNISQGKEISILFHLKTKAKQRGYIEKNEIDMINRVHLEIDPKKKEDILKTLEENGWT
jgi:hypothetical protein